MLKDYRIQKQLGKGKHTELLNYFRRQVRAALPGEKHLKIKQRRDAIRNLEDIVIEAYFAGLDDIKESKNGQANI